MHQRQFETVYQNVNELENKLEKGIDETHQRQFESVLGGYKGSEWCHNEVGGQATTIANYLQSMPSICRVGMRMSCEEPNSPILYNLGKLNLNKLLG